MTGPFSPATADIRRAVRSALQECDPGDLVLVALSGGADSMALAAATGAEAPALGIGAGAVIVDHGLLEHSAEAARAASDRAPGLGLDPVEIVEVRVAPTGQGIEAAARDARYAALEAAAARHGARLVLLGHTLDDQAEQVLLGLARGSGARSLAGMPAARGIFRRPLLGVERAATRSLCEAANLPWWDDPMNDDPAHARVRARRALRDLERDLGPGVVAALARSAAQLREDADHLDALADAALATLLPTLHSIESARNARKGGDSRAFRALSTGGDADAGHPTGGGADGGPSTGGDADGGPSTGGDAGTAVDVAVDELADLPRPVRTRVWRRLLLAAGAPAGQVSARHTEECDRLLTAWHGQGPLHVPGDLRVSRTAGRIVIGPR